MKIKAKPVTVRKHITLQESVYNWLKKTADDNNLSVGAVIDQLAATAAKEDKNGRAR